MKMESGKTRFIELRRSVRWLSKFGLRSQHRKPQTPNLQPPTTQTHTKPNQNNHNARHPPNKHQQKTSKMPRRRFEEAHGVPTPQEMVRHREQEEARQRSLPPKDLDEESGEFESAQVL